jgi:hypothetical protein
MTEIRPAVADARSTKYPLASTIDDDRAVMKKIRAIMARGNNAEVKQKKDGTLTVLEVKKQIV